MIKWLKIPKQRDEHLPPPLSQSPPSGNQVVPEAEAKSGTEIEQNQAVADNGEMGRSSGTGNGTTSDGPLSSVATAHAQPERAINASSFLNQLHRAGTDGTERDTRDASLIHRAGTRMKASELDSAI